MPFLKSVRIEPGPAADRTLHPFDVAAIEAMVERDVGLRIDPAVTVFVGDNGSGKSTLLEAIAVHQGLNPEGGARGMLFETTADAVSVLHQHLRVSRSHRRPRDVYFLRAESFFNVATAVDDAGSSDQYGGSLHRRSHGESFLDLTVKRFGPNSLFLLDEPEAALSIHGQLQFLVRMHDLVAEGCQFVLATHSPLLMSFPGATIYEFTDDGPTVSRWSELDTVQITADFLAHPDDFLAELFADDD